MVRGRLRRLAIAVLVSSLSAMALAPIVAPMLAHADARTDYLVRLLRTSDAFRVRAQAAISLASVPPEPEVIEALSAALRDDSAAVRAAAASSLERLGDPSVIPALRGVSRDREVAVRDAASRAITALERIARSGGGGRTDEIVAPSCLSRGGFGDPPGGCSGRRRRA